MLVLTRKLDEDIVIDGNIVVRVVEIGRGRVKLGIEAPAHVAVHREEIARRIKRRMSNTWKAEEAARERGDE